MKQWIPFKEGEYMVPRAFIVSPDDDIEPVAETVIEIYADASGLRHLKGSGRVENYRMVMLLEDHNTLDLILELGDDMVYRLPAPEFKGGKVFSPGVRSTMQFSPTVPWFEMPADALSALLEKADRR